MDYRKILSLFLLCLTMACSSTNSSATSPESLTLIGVDPKDFMASGACGTLIQSYVATLTDVTGPEGLDTTTASTEPFVVGSSPPEPCTEAVVFSNVVAYHAYEVTLDGYNRSDLQPAARGSSAMLAPEGYTAPAYSAVCRGWTDTDGGTQPGIAFPNVTVTLKNCSTLGSAAD